MSRHAARARPGQDRTGLYQEITDKIIAELEAGRAPWVQPWGTSGGEGAARHAEERPTQTALLGDQRAHPLGRRHRARLCGQSWLTFRQALSLGGHVRKGERGTTVVYADRFTPDDERRRAAETGEEAQAIPFLKRFTVFNTAQCEGLPDEMMAMAPPVETDLILPQAEALIRATGVDFRIGGERAFYDPRHDFVQVPPPAGLFRADQLAPDRPARNRPLPAAILPPQPRSVRLVRVEEIRVRGAGRRNFGRLLCASLGITPDRAPRRLYRLLARGAARGQPRHRARRQRRVEGGGLHPGVPVRNSEPTRQSRPTTKGRRPDGAFRLPGFSRNAEPDIRAPAFPAFRVCGPPRVRGLRRFS